MVSTEIAKALNGSNPTKLFDGLDNEKHILLMKDVYDSLEDEEFKFNKRVMENIRKILLSESIDIAARHFLIKRIVYAERGMKRLDSKQNASLNRIILSGDIKLYKWTVGLYETQNHSLFDAYKIDCVIDYKPYEDKDGSMFESLVEKLKQAPPKEFFDKYVSKLNEYAEKHYSGEN